MVPKIVLYLSPAVFLEDIDQSTVSEAIHTKKSHPPSIFSWSHERTWSTLLR